MTAPAIARDARQFGLFGGTYSPYCHRCGKSLSNPVSMQAGMGPVCRCKSPKGEIMHDEQFTDAYISEPLENGIILSRDANGTVRTNVPHLVVHHSPTGYEFGYMGSGPADLALNIVEAMLHRLGYNGPKDKCYDGECFRLAYRLHQSFKEYFVAPVPREEGIVLPYGMVREWIQAHMPDESQEE